MSEAFTPKRRATRIVTRVTTKNKTRVKTYVFIPPIGTWMLCVFFHSVVLANDRMDQLLKHGVRIRIAGEHPDLAVDVLDPGLDDVEEGSSVDGDETTEGQEHVLGEVALEE